MVKLKCAGKIRTGKLLHIYPLISPNINAIFFWIAKDAARSVQGFKPETFTQCLTLCILMDSSFHWYNQLGIIHYTYLGVPCYKFLNNIAFLSEDLFFTFTNNVESDEMRILWHFILVFNVCKRRQLVRLPKLLLGTSNYNGFSGPS